MKTARDYFPPSCLFINDTAELSSDARGCAEHVPSEALQGLAKYIWALRRCARKAFRCKIRAAVYRARRVRGLNERERIKPRCCSARLCVCVCSRVCSFDFAHEKDRVDSDVDKMVQESSLKKSDELCKMVIVIASRRSSEQNLSHVKRCKQQLHHERLFRVTLLRMYGPHMCRVNRCKQQLQY